MGGHRALSANRWKRARMLRSSAQMAAVGSSVGAGTEDRKQASGLPGTHAVAATAASGIIETLSDYDR